MKMPETLDLKNTAENVISSYEARIESVEAAFNTTHQIFDSREERLKLDAQLRDILSHNEHLRKKDFDRMTQSGLLAQEERETEVKNLLKCYLNQQKEMARALRENLAKFKDALAKGDAQRVKEFQGMIKAVIADQDARKEEVAAKLKEFQKEQQAMTERLKALLAKGRELRIKDLKLMLGEFKIQHKERLAQKIERIKKVNKVLGRLPDKIPEAMIEA